MTFALTIRTPADIAAADLEAAMEAQKAECRARILAVMDEVAQLNLAAAAATGSLAAEDMATYQAGLVWVAAMRSAWSTVPAVWPEPPPAVVALAARF